MENIMIYGFINNKINFILIVIVMVLKNLVGIYNVIDVQDFVLFQKEL